MYSICFYEDKGPFHRIEVESRAMARNVARQAARRHLTASVFVNNRTVGYFAYNRDTRKLAFKPSSTKFG